MTIKPMQVTGADIRRECKPIQSKRIAWIDAAKGTGILLVMFGHNWLSEDFVFWFTSFHMPLFFILAGITFSTKKDFRTFTLSKAKTLLIPYVFFAVCSISFYTLLSMSHSGTYDTKGEAMRFLIQDHHTCLWFLMAMFISDIAAYIIMRGVIEKTPFRQEPAVLTAIISFLFAFHWYSVEQGWIKLAYTLDLVPACTAFIMIGILYKRHFMGHRLESKISVICLLAIVSLAASTCNYFNYSRVDMFSCEYGYYPLFIIGACAASFFLILTLKKLSVPQWLLYIGLYSLVFFGFHRFIIEIMFSSYGKLNITFDGESLYGVVLALINICIH